MSLKNSLISSPTPACAGAAATERAITPIPMRDTATQIRATNVRRSEEHTSELQSLMRISYAVFCLKKKIPFIYTHMLRVLYPYTISYLILCLRLHTSYII